MVCYTEDLLKIEGMDNKLSEPITAAHLISASRMGNSKADAVLHKGQNTKNHSCTHTNTWLCWRNKENVFIITALTFTWLERPDG